RSVQERQERDDTEHVLQERHRASVDPRQRHAAQLGIHLGLRLTPGAPPSQEARVCRKTRVRIGAAERPTEEDSSGSPVGSVKNAYSSVFLGVSPRVAVTRDCLDARSRFILGPSESKTAARLYPVSVKACLSLGVYTSTETSYRAWSFEAFFDFTTALISCTKGKTLQSSEESLSN